MKRLIIMTGVLMMLFLSSCRDIANSVLDLLPPFDVTFSTNIEIPFAAVSTTSYTRTPEIPMNINLDAKIKEQNPKYGIDNLKSVKLNTLTVDYISSQLGNKLDAVSYTHLDVYKRQVFTVQNHQFSVVSVFSWMFCQKFFRQMEVKVRCLH